MLLQDVKYGLRMLVKSPGFSLVAVLSLALGIGANTAIFSLVNAVLLRPLPVADPEHLVSVSTTDLKNPGNLPLSHLNFKDLRAQNAAFTDMAAYTFNQVNYSAGREAEQIPVQVVTANYFSLLGAQPALGRGFLPEEEATAAPVAVLSDAFWEHSLGSDPNIVGQTLTFNRIPYTVIGVAPRHFAGTLLGAGPSAWLLMSQARVPQQAWWETRRGLFLFAFGRLKPGVTPAQADANLRTVFANLERAFPVDNKGRSATGVPLLAARLDPNGRGGNQITRLSSLLMVIVGIVLLIACGNIANLLLARASKRRREVAIRLAMGARRSRLVAQLLTESVMLSILGGAGGLLLAYWTISTIVAAKLPLPFPADDTLTLDPRVLIFTTVLSLLTGVLFGLAPALQASKADVVPVLKNELVPSAATGRGLKGLLSLRQALVVVQIALSVVSLIAGGLFLRDLRHAQSIDPGFVTSGVLMANVNLNREGYTPERGAVFYDRVVERLHGMPGVQDVAIAQNAPLAGGLLRSVLMEGADTTTKDRILVQVNTVSSGYFETMGIPILRGRGLADSDLPTSPRVVVVNETMAQQFWKGDEAIGKRFKFFGDQDYTTVVGVARNSKYNGVAEDPIPFIYESLKQDYTPAAALHVRSAGDAAGLAGSVRQAIREIDPTLSMFNVRTLDEQVSQSLQPQRMNVILLTTFGGLALLLASIGLYGVASYSVAQRTREIGVRMALGAQPASVLGLVLGNGLTLVGVGLGVGLAVALALAGTMQTLVVGVNPRDPVTFIATPAILGTIALVATYVPARRATRIDPLIALRTD
jgi:predicted permease